MFASDLCVLSTVPRQDTALSGPGNAWLALTSLALQCLLRNKFLIIFSPLALSSQDLRENTIQAIPRKRLSVELQISKFVSISLRGKALEWCRPILQHPHDGSPGAQAARAGLGSEMASCQHGFQKWTWVVDAQIEGISSALGTQLKVSVINSDFPSLFH